VYFRELDTLEKYETLQYELTLQVVEREEIVPDVEERAPPIDVDITDLDFYGKVTLDFSEKVSPEDFDISFSVEFEGEVIEVPFEFLR